MAEPSPPVATRAAVVVLAAGSGSRVGAGRNKVLLPLAGVPVLVHSVRRALDVPGVHRLVVVVRREDRDAVSEALVPHLGSHDVWLVDGGAQRHDSEYAALRALRADIEAGEIEVVALHDAARPLASADLFQRVLAHAAAHGAAVPAVGPQPLSNADGSRAGTDLYAVQTPQAFAAGPLLEAYRRADLDAFAGTDTAACVARYTDVRIGLVEGEATNVKVTFAEDLALADELLTAAADPRGRSGLRNG